MDNVENKKPEELGPMVDIKIDENDILIHRGHHTILEIKQAGGVPSAYDFEQIVDGKLILLSDDGGFTIKGNEVFVSHPKDSSSS